MNKSVFDDHANEFTVVIIPATKKLTSRGGGGGGGTPLCGLCGDVLLDKLWFFASSALNRTVNNFRRICP